MNDWPTDPVDEIMQLVRQQDAIGYEERMVLVAEIERLRNALKPAPGWLAEYIRQCIKRRYKAK